MVRKMLWSLPLFLVISIMSCDVSVVVDAFMTTSRTRCPSFSTHGRAIEWSSKVSAVAEKASSAEVTTGKDSSSKETETKSTVAVNSNGDMNNDADIEAIMNDEKTEEGADGESDEDNLMQQIKDSGVAGVISYAAWELAFWTVSVPVCVLGYKEVTGHWPDLNDKDDLSKLGAEAFAFVNFARFAVPLRIGLALSTTPWIQENIVDVFLADKEKNDDEEEIATKDSDEENEADDCPDETAIEEITERKGILSRVRSRIGNLINRVLKRKKQSQGEEKE